MTIKSGRKRAELRGESAGARELAAVLRDLADSHGRTLRDLEQGMPYSRTTISARLNSETRPDWKFVVQFLQACTGSDRRAMAQLEGKVRPLWDAAAPRRARQGPLTFFMGAGQRLRCSRESGGAGMALCPLQ